MLAEQQRKRNKLVEEQAYLEEYLDLLEDCTDAESVRLKDQLELDLVKVQLSLRELSN